MEKINIKGKSVPLPVGFEKIGDMLTMEDFEHQCDSHVVCVLLDDGQELSGSYNRIKKGLNICWADAVAVKHLFHLRDSYDEECSDNDVRSNLPEQEVIEHPLYEICVDAIRQALHGKGQRHGGGKTPFLEQPWKHTAEMHGRGFLTGQVSKKCDEAASTRQGEAFETEMLGAIVYAGAAVLFERTKNAN